MNSQGKGVKRLTNTKVPPLLQGLFPTDWSANGARLLAEFQGQDTSYAVASIRRERARPGAGRLGTASTDAGLGDEAGFNRSGSRSNLRRRH